MRKILSFIALAFSLLVPAFTHAEIQDKLPVSIGAVTSTATSSSYVQFFRPDGSLSTAVTYTSSTIVPQGIYIERVTVYGISDTASVTFSLLSTDATVTAGTNEKQLYQGILSSGYDTNLNIPRTYDFTSNGTNSGLKCPKWPAVRVDAGTNTPIVHIFYKVAPKNKLQGASGS